jgi:hypothetical protein
VSNIFYRATLTLERVEPTTTQYGNPSENGTEIAQIAVTGDTPADAMYQIHNHAETLHQWHDEPQPIIDEAFNLPADHPLAKAFADMIIGTPANFKPQGFLHPPAAEQPAEPATDDSAPDVRCTICGRIALCFDGDWVHESGPAADRHEAAPPETDGTCTYCGEPADPDHHTSCAVNRFAAPAKAAQTPEAENRCAHCGEAIALVGGTWYHDMPGHRRTKGHDATPANLTAPHGWHDETTGLVSGGLITD